MVCTIAHGGGRLGRTQYKRPPLLLLRPSTPLALRPWSYLWESHVVYAAPTLPPTVRLGSSYPSSILPSPHQNKVAPDQPPQAPGNTSSRTTRTKTERGKQAPTHYIACTDKPKRRRRCNKGCFQHNTTRCAPNGETGRGSTQQPTRSKDPKDRHTEPTTGRSKDQ